ncbi:hypothetical protein K2X40_00635 [Candidatus Babeliales bacterium]|nr:hypothetical protein [Candidatus Babeliales bacterium]
MKKLVVLVFLFTSIFSNVSGAAFVAHKIKKLFGRREALLSDIKISPRGILDIIYSEDRQWAVKYYPGKKRADDEAEIEFGSLAVYCLRGQFTKVIELPCIDSHFSRLNLEVVYEVGRPAELCVIKDGLLWVRFFIAELEQKILQNH